MLEKRGNPVRSEKQVAQDVGIRSKIARTNVKKDEFTIVDTYIQFEISTAEVGSQAKPMFNNRIGIGFTRTALHLTTLLIGTRAGPNLTDEDYLTPQWKLLTKCLESPKLATATK